MRTQNKTEQRTPLAMLDTSILVTDSSPSSGRMNQAISGSDLEPRTSEKSAHAHWRESVSLAKDTALVATPGQIIKRRALPGFVLTESLYDGGFKSSESHPLHRLSFVLKGSYTSFFRNELHQVEDAKGIFLPPGEVHTISSAAGARCLHLELTQEWVDRIAERQCIKLSSPRVFQSCLLPSLVRRLYQELNQEGESSLLAVEGLAFEILAEIVRSQPSRTDATTQSKLDQAKEFLEANFAVPFTVAEAAQSVGLHPVYLAALFRKTLRCTMKDYVRRLRVNFAAAKLAESAEPLVDIGMAAGFVDQSHFCRTFKYLIGMTPSEYRTHHQKSSPDSTLLIDTRQT